MLAKGETLTKSPGKSSNKYSMKDFSMKLPKKMVLGFMNLKEEDITVAHYEM